MQFQLNIEIPDLKPSINYDDSILLVGSCFSEHMSERLINHRFKVLNNPNGILFNPLSVCDALDSYVQCREYEPVDLFYLNELWNSWDFHTRFSHICQQDALQGIQSSIAEAHQFVKSATRIIITLGSSFQYYLVENGRPVSNNHRAPSQWFEKRLLAIEVIEHRLRKTIAGIKNLNPGVQFIFTISPVRHIRDGVIANNRSKARLLEAVHSVCESEQGCYYFPSYELLIDVLRDYRFYDVDFVHPNFPATQFVWEMFVKHCIAPTEYRLMEQLKEITIAASHKPRFPDTEAHKKFRENYQKKITELDKKYPQLNIKELLIYF